MIQVTASTTSPTFSRFHRCLLEKYIQAAESIVTAAVPTISRLIPERTYRGIEFHAAEGGGNGDRMSIYKKTKVKRLISADVDGDYRLAIEISVHGSFDYDPGQMHADREVR